MAAFDFGQVWSVCARIGQIAVIVVILVVNQIYLSGTGLKEPWVPNLSEPDAAAGSEYVLAGRL
jgi:hypothetical protein